MADWLNAIAQLLGQPLPGDPGAEPFKLQGAASLGGDLFKLGQGPPAASGPLKFGSQGGVGNQGGRFSLPPGPVAPGATPELKELRQRQSQRAEVLKRGQAGTLPGQQAGQFAATADAFAGQPVAQQIMAQAAQKYGPDAAQVVGAVLLGEGGLGGAVGDRDISAVGSHGPFQFYGPGGQLDNYARARNLTLEQAGAQARQNPLDAASWALDTYLGQPLQAGVAAGERGEPLLRRVLQAQNPGALNSPQHLQRYTQALQQMSAAATGSPPGNPPTNLPAQSLLSTLDTYVGTPYVLGGTARSGIDCSGLIVAAMRDLGRPLPGGVRTAQQIHNYAQPVAANAVQPGDLVFFEGTYAGNPGERDTHVGVVTQNGVMVNASGANVNYADFQNNPYWRTKITGYGRLP